MKKLMAIVLCAAMLASMLCVNAFANTNTTVEETNLAANATVSVSYVDITKTETPSDTKLNLINDGDYETNSNASAYWKVEDGQVAVSVKLDKAYALTHLFLATENWYIQGDNQPLHTQKLQFEAKVNDTWISITEIFDDVEKAGVESIDQAKNLVPNTIELGSYIVTDEIRLVFLECTRAYFNVKEIMVYGVETDNIVPPELVITEMDCNPSGDDEWECIEIFNTTDSDINLYDYVIGYCGEKVTKTDYYEKIMVEITPFRENWLDLGEDSTVQYTATEMNPASGIIGPNEVAVIWMVSNVCYDATTNAMRSDVTLAKFREFWGMDENVKVFMVDANSDKTNKNFNMKNKDTGTYIIAKHTEEMDTVANVKGGTGYITENGFMYDPNIVSWATYNFNDTTSPSYIVMSQGDGLKDGGAPKSDMKSLSFVFNTENMKRMVPSVCGDHTMGKLDDTQKALYMPVVEETPEETTTTPVEETTTVPTDDVTTTSPADDVTTTAPADETTAPADETTTAIPENTTKAPENTTKAPEEPSKKSCGGFALAAQLVTILGAAVTVVIVKKK